MEVTEEDGVIHFSVSYEDKFTKKKHNWKFKDFSVKEFMSINMDVSAFSDKNPQEKVILPMIALANAMKVEGDVINIEMPMRVLNFLKKELQDFL